jgi:hypothetical protein
MMDSYFWLLLALTTAIVAGLLLGSVVSCEPNPEVVVQIEFPSKKEDRHQQYWFLTMARGYSI